MTLFKERRKKAGWIATLKSWASVLSPSRGKKILLSNPGLGKQRRRWRILCGGDEAEISEAMLCAG